MLNLNFKMLNLDQDTRLIKLARKSIESHFSGQKFDFEDEKKEFNKKLGVFVTINKFPSHELRGCIGFPYPTKILAEAVVASSKHAAFSDPRFAPLDKKDLDKIVIEISVLTEPKEIKIKGQAILQEIKIGRDGLIIQFSDYSGLLLPQVAPEQKWNVLEFLRGTCIKAGLPSEIWLNPVCKIFKFQAQIFSEKEPNGKIEKQS